MGDDADSDVSTAEQHAALPDRTALSFAATDGTSFNAVRFPLAPVACWRLGWPGFAFDSSFVAPVFKSEILKLQGIVEKNPACPAALFGHCDPAGSDDLNKTLSDRRAIAIYALLTRQVAMWADLYDNPQVGDTWGTMALQTILGSIEDKQSTVYYDGAIDGDYGSGTTAGVKRFQPSASLPATGKADAATRDALFAAYMDWLCTPNVPQGTQVPPAFQMKTSDFLGNGGQADLPKMSVQGCSEFNPVVLLPASEMKNSANNAQRDTDDAPNRRAVMFFFNKGTTVDSAAWPCPKVKESLAGCKEAFWPDGEARRKNGKDLREYKKTRDTMACRFYDRFARRSPCEVSTVLRIWLQDDSRQRMPNAKFKLVICGRTVCGTSDDQGLILVQAPPTATTCTLEWGDMKDTSSSETVYCYRRDLDVRRAPSDPQTRGLDNLAYLGKTEQERQASFDADYPNATVSDVHDNGIPKEAKA